MSDKLLTNRQAEDAGVTGELDEGIRRFGNVPTAEANVYLGAVQTALWMSTHIATLMPQIKTKTYLSQTLGVLCF
jgi:hypothetical protein